MTTTPDIRTGARMNLVEFLDLPAQETRCELIDGVVYMAAFPVPDHEILVMLLATHLSHSIMLTGAGIVMGTAGVVVSANSALGPDIIVVRSERNDIIGPTVLTGAPDIVVEALSSDRNRDLVDKRRLYEAAGVPEYWIMDGDADTLTILELTDDASYQERAVLTAADTLTTPLFPDFSLPLAQVFDHPARIRSQD
ncbi:MAG: Uma2 family endonuclease [Chloroflexi bacterium]|nr:Uma2 family endonuclease [Chloroflexota bacterium]